MKSQKVIARTFGIFFLLAVLSYGLGTGMTSSVTGVTDALANVQANKTQLIIGVMINKQ